MDDLLDQDFSLSLLQSWRTLWRLTKDHELEPTSIYYVPCGGEAITLLFPTIPER